MFLFLIGLMFFSLRMEHAVHRSTDAIATLSGTEPVRTKILNTLKNDLSRQGLAVQINPVEGVLSLSEALLFDKGKAELAKRGEDALAVLAQSLFNSVFCYAAPIEGMVRKACSVTVYSLEAIIIEGHTDSDGNDTGNWNFSVKRAFNVYQTLMGASAGLARLVNLNQQTLFSLSGYGKGRPIKPNDTDENKQRNRRIDIRLVMTSPSATLIHAVIP
ncbi:MAG: OmpA family protein [Rhodospirillaceae bacterium]